MKVFDGAERMFDIAAYIGGKTKFTMVCIFKENTKCSGCQLLKYVFITLCIAKIVLLLLGRAKNRFSVSSHSRMNITLYLPGTTFTLVFLSRIYCLPLHRPLSSVYRCPRSRNSSEGYLHFRHLIKLKGEECHAPIQTKSLNVIKWQVNERSRVQVTYQLMIQPF